MRKSNSNQQKIFLRSFTSEHKGASLLRLQIQSLPSPTSNPSPNQKIPKHPLYHHTSGYLFFQLRYQYKAIKHHPKRHLLIEGHLLQDPNLRTNKNIAVGIFVGQTLGEAGRFICKQHRARRYLKQLSNIGFWELNAHTFDSWSSSF